MAIDARARDAGAVGRRRVTVDNRSDVVFALRDYLLGLGVESAVVAGPTAIEVGDDVDDTELELYIRNWTTVNDVRVRIERYDTELRGTASPPSEQGSPRLGELLVRKGLVREEQLTLALAESRRTGELLGAVLIRRQLIFEEELARTLSEQLAVPYVSIARIGVDSRVARLLPASVGAATAAIPVRSREGTVQVAFADPTDPDAVADVREHLPTITLAVAELSDIKLAWRQVAQMRFGARLPALD